MSVATIKVLAMIAYLLSLLFIIEILCKRYQWHPELCRKLSHMGFGLTALSFPLIFSDTWQVVAVCSAAIFKLLLIRIVPRLRHSVGRSIFDVERSSLGDLLFVVSTMVLFFFSRGNVALYIMPMAILTVADATAALIGTYRGKKLYMVRGGKKSWEGSLAFSGITFVILMTIQIWGVVLPWTSLFMVAVMFSILGAMIEAVSWNGFDNLFIPLAAYLFLSMTMDKSEGQIFSLLLVLIGLVSLGVLVRWKYQLSLQTIVITIISLFFLRMFGFIAWVWVPVLVFFCHIAVIEFQMSKPHYSPDTIFISAGVCLLWCLREELFHIPFGFFLLASTLAIHIQIAIQMALKEQKRKDFEVFVVALSSWLFGSTSLFYCIFLWGANDKKLAFFIMSALVILTAGSIARRHLSQFRSKRQVMELGLSLIGSTSTLVPILMIGRGI